MRRGREWVESQTHLGAEIVVGDRVITPQSQSLSIIGPHGGWAWNRPVAILVRQGKETKRIPIVDVTRLAQLALFGASILAVGLAFIAKRSR